MYCINVALYNNFENNPLADEEKGDAKGRGGFILLCSDPPPPKNSGNFQD